MSNPAPVIAIDGPSASGKGTVAHKVAEALGFHFLDSGALYRLVAMAAMNRGIELDDAPALAALALDLDARFDSSTIKLDGHDVTDAIREERVSGAASKVAALQPVRDALLARQRAFREAPGLVADGRDMGSVVFPDATLKIFLTADAAERARRRYKQLIEKGMSARMDVLLQEIRDRDARDSKRAAAPLQKCADAVELDTTGIPVDAAVAQVLALYRGK
ncbi:MAG: Cytidylate kinase [Betaproteobacteria bacterium]|nr:Cytidylate kinase [Betaproteobacteria bacterium]